MGNGQFVPLPGPNGGPGFRQVFPGPGPRFREMFPMYVHNGHGHPLAWVVFGLLILTLLLVTMLVAARFTGGPPRRWRHLAFAGGPPGLQPLELLRMRYARGEIGRDEFLQASSD